MKQPENIPEAVVKAIARYADQHADRKPDGSDDFLARAKLEIQLLRELKFDSLNGCYFFIRNNMYHGVELDGYIHT